MQALPIGQSGAGHGKQPGQQLVHVGRHARLPFACATPTHGRTEHGAASVSQQHAALRRADHGGLRQALQRVREELAQVAQARAHAVDRFHAVVERTAGRPTRRRRPEQAGLGLQPGGFLAEAQHRLGAASSTAGRTAGSRRWRRPGRTRGAPAHQQQAGGEGRAGQQHADQQCARGASISAASAASRIGSKVPSQNQWCRHRHDRAALLQGLDGVGQDLDAAHAAAVARHRGREHVAEPGGRRAHQHRLAAEHFGRHRARQHVAHGYARKVPGGKGMRTGSAAASRRRRGRDRERSRDGSPPPGARCGRIRRSPPRNASARRRAAPPAGIHGAPRRPRRPPCRYGRCRRRPAGQRIADGPAAADGLRRGRQHHVAGTRHAARQRHVVARRAQIRLREDDIRPITRGLPAAM